MSIEEECSALRDLLQEERRIHRKGIHRLRERLDSSKARERETRAELEHLRAALRELVGCA